MHTIAIDKDIKTQLSNIQFGLLECTQIKVKSKAQNWEDSVAELQAYLHHKFKDSAPSSEPIIAAIRKMYRSVGWDPTKYRPSSEALVRRILQNRGLYQINNVVDLANLISARYHIPMGLYDLDKVKGPIQMGVGRPDESYAGISKSKINAEGKIILRDEVGIFGNPTADSRRTMVETSTQHILALFFCPHTVEKVYINNMLMHLSEFYKPYCQEENISIYIQEA